jgi:hypothetical protein
LICHKEWARCREWNRGRIQSLKNLGSDKIIAGAGIEECGDWDTRGVGVRFGDIKSDKEERFGMIWGGRGCFDGWRYRA